MRDDGWKPISEPRITRLLETRLRETGRPGEDRSPSLRTPPLDPQVPGREPPGIEATIFPCWFVADAAVQIPTGRRLVPWTQLDLGGRRPFAGDDCKKADVTSIRFVAACEKGHI